MAQLDIRLQLVIAEFSHTGRGRRAARRALATHSFQKTPILKHQSWQFPTGVSNVGRCSFSVFCAYEVCAHFGPSRMQNYTAQRTHCCMLQPQRPRALLRINCVVFFCCRFLFLFAPPPHTTMMPQQPQWSTECRGQVLRRPRSILDCPSAPRSHACVDILKALE